MRPPRVTSLGGRSAVLCGIIVLILVGLAGAGGNAPGSNEAEPVAAAKESPRKVRQGPRVVGKPPRPGGRDRAGARLRWVVPPRAGGFGLVRVRAAVLRGDIRGRRARVRLALPDGLRFAGRRGKGWRCKRRGSGARCVGRRRARTVTLRVRVAKRLAHRRVRVRASVAFPGRPRARDGGQADTRVRRPLGLSLRALPELIADRRTAPGLEGDAGRGSLRAVVTHRGNTRVRLRWRADGPQPRWLGLARGQRSPTGGDVRYEVPDVDENKTLRFSVTAYDGANSVTKRVRVHVLDRGSGPLEEGTDPQPGTAELKLAADRRVSAVAGEEVTLGARASGESPLLFDWRQLSGEKVAGVGSADGATLRFTAPATPGELEFEVSVKDGAEATAVRKVTLDVSGGGGRAARPVASTSASAESASSVQIGACSIDVSAGHGSATNCPVVSNLMLSNVTATKQGGAITVAGSGQISFPTLLPISVSLNGTIADTESYSLALTSSSWTILGQLVFQNLQGTVSQGANGFAVSLGGSLASYDPAPGAELSDMQLALGAECVRCAPGTLTVAGTLSGEATVSPNPTSPTFDVSGTFSASVGTELEAITITSAGASGGDVALHDITATIVFDPNATSGMTVSATGQADIAEWRDKQFRVEFTPDGQTLDVNLGGVTGAQSIGVVYSTMELTDYTPLAISEAIDVQAETLTLVANVNVPSQVESFTGIDLGQTVMTVGTINPTTGDWSLKVDAPGGTSHQIFNQNGFVMTISNVGFSVWRNAGADVRFGLSGHLTVSMPGARNLGLDLDGAWDLSVPGFSASAKLPGNVLNGLGIRGLSISGFEASFTTSALGQLWGLAGDVSLPSWFSNFLGVPGSNPPPASFATQLGEGPPCMAVKIGSPGSGKRAIDLLGKGLVTADYGDFVYAPAPGGCTVGDVSYSQGYGFATDMSLFGAPVTVNAKMIIRNTQIISLESQATIGTVELGPVSVDNASVSVDYSSAFGGQLKVGVSGEVDLMGPRIDVEGSLSASAGGASLELATSVTPTVGGLALGDARLNLDFEGTNAPGGTTSFSSVDATLAAELPILGLDPTVTFTVAYSGGVVDGLDPGTLSLPTIRVLKGSLGGSVHPKWELGEGWSATFTGSAAIDGIASVSVSGELSDDFTTVTIASGAISQSATLDFDVVRFQANFSISFSATVGPTTPPDISVSGSAGVSESNQFTDKICQTPVVGPIVCKVVKRFTDFSFQGSFSAHYRSPGQVYVSVAGYDLSVSI